MSSKKIRTGIIGYVTTSRFHFSKKFMDKNTRLATMFTAFQKFIDVLSIKFTAAKKEIPPKESNVQKLLKSFDSTLN